MNDDDLGRLSFEWGSNPVRRQRVQNEVGVAGPPQVVVHCEAALAREGRAEPTPAADVRGHAADPCWNSLRSDEIEYVSRDQDCVESPAQVDARDVGPEPSDPRSTQARRLEHLGIDVETNHFDSLLGHEARNVAAAATCIQHCPRPQLPDSPGGRKYVFAVGEAACDRRLVQLASSRQPVLLRASARAASIPSG